MKYYILYKTDQWDHPFSRKVLVVSNRFKDIAKVIDLKIKEEKMSYKNFDKLDSFVNYLKRRKVRFYRIGNKEVDIINSNLYLGGIKIVKRGEVIDIY